MGRQGFLDRRARMRAAAVGAVLGAVSLGFAIPAATAARRGDATTTLTVGELER